MATDLDKMSKDELMKLRKDVDRALDGVSDRERKAALDAAEKAARDHGFSLSELSGPATKKGKTKSKSPAKFRNPENPDQTWSGRGRKPDWFKSAENAGKDVSKFAI